MTSYYASNEYGVFHFVMGTQPTDILITVLAVTAAIILVGAWIITHKIRATHP